MDSLDEPLPDDLDTCHQLIRELLETLREQMFLNEKLQHQLERLLRRLYGRKSEKLDPNQLLLFAREILTAAGDDPAAPAPPAPAPSPPATPARPAEKEGHGRKPLPPGLPRRRVIHDIPPDQLPCPDCGATRTRLGEEVRPQLEFIPASLVVLEHVRPKYVCTACESHVVIAQRLPEPIEKGLPGPGLLAQVITSKYADHLPLYRQEGIFRRFGVDLSRQTTCDWMRVCAELLEPIWKELLRRVKLSAVIQTDDTPVTVLGRGPDGTHQGRLWVYLGDSAHPYVVFDYTPDRCGTGPQGILQGFRGYLQADAYSGYDALYAGGGVKEVGCWMHARRKFYEARTSDPARAHQALAWISRLYDVERDAKTAGLDDEARRAFRDQRARPILEEIGRWLEAQRGQVLPKSPIGEAIGYASNQWAALNRYLESGSLEIDNGSSERALRPVAVGRSNWLFLGSDRGGRTAAILMSLCATCKRLGVDVLAYLKDVLDRVSTHPASRIGELVPDRWQAIRAGPS
jgi:transposase